MANGKVSNIPYDPNLAVTLWTQLQHARQLCGLTVPNMADMVKGWTEADFNAAVPEAERYSWFLACMYLDLVLTEEWKDSHKEHIHFELEDCRKALGEAND